LRDISEAVFAACAFGVIAATLIARPELIAYAPRAPGEIAFIALRAFFIPALGEELVFRAALIPGPDEGVKPALPIAISTLVFTLWHVTETAFLPNSAATFLRPDFLTLAALLGVACAILRWRSGSIWTAVALHWIAVVAWQGWFGGPSFGAAD
jgi:predicted Abi (CAAX) family protease